ncbi:ABC transporter permease [Labrys monachus]|uniref:Ribose transport system permease protein n=1 Tax=Labrys monachus TaxID=217067 RepID=A0ABU0FJA2_9HYPH|nr:ABC transporter permease [Labrys monachus]MDQ0394184.1 ribose transport system permease protein [Labrys monachus]
MHGDDTSAAAPAPTAAKPVRSGSIRFYLTNEFGLVVLIAVFAGIFGLMTDGRFFSTFNQFTLGRVAAVNIMVGFSMMVVIVTGGLNLAVGAIGVCSAMVFGFLAQVGGLPWPAAVVGAIATGALLGWVNGFVIVRSGLHSFIITLASMSIFFGLMLYLTKAESYRGIPPDFSEFGRARLFGVVSPMLVVAFAAGVLLVLLYRYTVIGREMLAAGARPEAAELSGVRVGRIFILCHMLSGAIAAATALLVVARTGAAIPSMAGQLGQDWLLLAFLGPVLGGTLLSGGRVSVIGTLLGAILVTMLTNGLNLLQIGEFWVQACLGILLLLAVLIDLMRRSYLAHRRMV